MKTLVLSMISIAATVAAMTACTSESDPVDEIVNPKDAKVEIKLSTGVGSITTKATPIEEFNNSDVTLLRQDISSDGNTDWGSNTVSEEYQLSNTAIPLAISQKYFNNDESLKSIFVGFYPTTGASRNNDKVTYIITGEEDLLCSQELNVGTKVAQTPTPKLTFKHLLSQVDINVVGTSNANTVFGEITSITLSMPTSVEVSLKTAKATSSASTETITVFNNSTNQSISDLATSKPVGSKFVLPEYGTTSKQLTVTINLSKAGTSSSKTVNIENIETQVDGNTVQGLIPGYKHIITLTFNDNVTITSDIETINPGGNGSGEIGE